MNDNLEVGGDIINGFEACKIALMSALIWYIVCRAVMLAVPIKLDNAKKVGDIHLRIVNSIYSIFIVILGIYYNLSANLECGKKDTDDLKTWILMSIGYHIYDLIMFKSKGVLLTFKIIHHSLALVGQMESLYKGMGGSIMIYMAIWLEVCAPAVQIRKILLNLDMRNTKIFVLDELFYIGGYLVSWTFYTKSCYTYYSNCSDDLYILKLSVVGLNIQSIYLIYQMVEILRSRWSEYLERRAKSVSLLWFAVAPQTANLDYVIKYLKSKNE